ncbi:MAG: hypothetical protein GWN85_14420, partial [Gemmatimonadetes bacterium]|nr:hypothetical protein [Gemmatimonadota bacterium]NIR36895.1 hypothetical protein [Actinomycetota bacterium]NIX20738.1 hypothetical protein [Actinomycetota bacterium]
MRTVETLAAIVVLFAFPPAADAQARPVTGVVRIGGEPTSEVVVYLEGEETAGASEADRNAGPPVIDQNHLRFLPGVVAVRAGTEVDFLNSD